MSYEDLHRFLLPNHAISDVLLDLSKITKEAEVKPSPEVKSTPEVKPDKLPRKQRRLQERVHTKAMEKEKKEKQRKAEAAENIKKTLSQIKKSVRTENSDTSRIESIIFGKTDIN